MALSEPSHEFDAIYVIESLPPGDPKTGEELYDQVIQRVVLRYPEVETRLFQPRNRGAFGEALDEVRKRVESGRTPVVHMEAHGLREQTGVALADHSVVRWEDLSTRLREINRGCGLNLLATFGACWGIQFAREITPIAPAPVWGVLGPVRNIANGRVVEGFATFYETFLDSLNGLAALQAMNGSAPVESWDFNFYTAEHLFAAGYQKYLEAEAGPEAAARREAEVVRRLRSRKKYKGHSNSALVRMIREVAPSSEEAFETFRERFFMVDVFPENDNRFATSFTDLDRYSLTNGAQA